jgi:hypothetical protein
MLAIARVYETPKKLAPEVPSVVTPSERPLGRHFLSKQELALAIGVSPRTIDSWMSQKRIPFLRLSPRLIKFNLDRVKMALARYEVKEVGARP